jgi:predicted lipoprotein
MCDVSLDSGESNDSQHGAAAEGPKMVENLDALKSLPYIDSKLGRFQPARTSAKQRSQQPRTNYPACIFAADSLFLTTHYGRRWALR